MQHWCFVYLNCQPKKSRHLDLGDPPPGLSGSILSAANGRRRQWSLRVCGAAMLLDGFLVALPGENSGSTAGTWATTTSRGRSCCDFRLGSPAWCGRLFEVLAWLGAECKEWRRWKEQTNVFKVVSVWHRRACFVYVVSRGDFTVANQKIPAAQKSGGDTMITLIVRCQMAWQPAWLYFWTCFPIFSPREQAIKQTHDDAMECSLGFSLPGIIIRYQDP